MPGKGPAPKPTALKLLEGNPRDRKIPENEPQYPALDVGEPPATLPEEGQKKWLELGPALASAGVLQVVDQALFYRYCEMWAKWWAVKLKLEQTGDYYPVMKAVYEAGEDGKHKPKMRLNTNTGKMEHEHRVEKIRAYPQLKEFKELSVLLLRMEQEMGMTPAARSRIIAANGAGEGARKPTNIFDTDDDEEFY